MEYFDIKTYHTTIDYLRSRLPLELHQVKVGIICGSGLGGLVKCFDSAVVEVDYKDIPFFAQSTVVGHAGKLVFGWIKGLKVVVMVGRKHLYEGHSILKTVYPVRIMKLLGAERLIVTNAAGGLNPKFNIGDIMVISDHVSFAGMGGANPLIGPNISDLGPRFPPTSDAYDYRTRVLAIKAAVKAGIPIDIIREGIYTFVAGPSFETRAEARFLRDAVGADCVGMSTVPEVVAARHMGMKVLGLSLITNMVSVGQGRSALLQARYEIEKESLISSGMSTPELVADDELRLANHEEVLHTSNVRSDQMQELVKTFLEMIMNQHLN